MQLVTPSVVPTAVSTAIITCKIVFQTSFFIFFFLSFFKGSTISFFSSGSSVSFLKLLIGIGVHSPVASQFFLVVNSAYL